jgi:catechol 2,3-dioxygenase-like lactoylglutathione lyase family enzyme
MYSHVTIGVGDFDRAVAFYDQLLAPLGLTEIARHGDAVGYAATPDAPPQFWITRPFDGGAASPGNGGMVAFLAADREAVRTIHAIALAGGGSCEGPPGLRPHYHADYYGAYMRDPDGNKLCVVCHASPG